MLIQKGRLKAFELKSGQKIRISDEINFFLDNVKHSRHKDVREKNYVCNYSKN